MYHQHQKSILNDQSNNLIKPILRIACMPPSLPQLASLHTYYLLILSKFLMQALSSITFLFIPFTGQLINRLPVSTFLPSYDLQLLKGGSIGAPHRLSLITL